MDEEKQEKRNGGDSEKGSDTSGVLRTLAALRAIFFSCFSLSWAAKISIWVGGLISRFAVFPLLRIPWPNSTPC